MSVLEILPCPAAVIGGYLEIYGVSARNSLDDSLYKRRYSASTNLIKPIVKREEVNPSELFDDPKPIDGYWIPEEYLRRFEHPVTGLEHLEYLMVAIDKPRGYKSWPRGKKVSDKEYFKTFYAEEQQSLFD